MNLNLTLFKKLALATLITGIFIPTNIAKAASSASTNKAYIQPENLERKELTGENYETGRSSTLLLSKKAQQIGFFTFLILSSCSLSLVATEFLCKPKKNSQSLKTGDTEEKQRNEINELEQKLGSLKDISQNPKRLTLVSDNRQELKNEEEKIELDQSEQEQKAA